MKGNSGGVDTKSLTTGAAAAWITVLVAPPIYDLTAPYVHRILVQHYGYELADLLMFGHMVGVGAVTYAASHRGLIIVLTLIATAIARYSWMLVR